MELMEGLHPQKRRVICKAVLLIQQTNRCNFLNEAGAVVVLQIIWRLQIQTQHYLMLNTPSRSLKRA
jgi:hypothetical protein